MRAGAISEGTLLPEDFEEPVERTNTKAGIGPTTCATGRRRFVGRDGGRISAERTSILPDPQIFDLTLPHGSKVKQEQSNKSDFGGDWIRSGMYLEC
jgi:hypothetical protein